MNWKKIALIIGFLIVTVGLGYVLYRFFFAAVPASAPPTTTPSGTTQGGGLTPAGSAQPPQAGGTSQAPTGLPTAQNLPTVAAGGPTQTTPAGGGAPVLAPKSSSNGLTYYNQSDGKFYLQLPDGTVKAISDKSFPGAQDVQWSPKGNKAILEFPDQSKVIYDFQSQKQVSLPRYWQDFSFSADGSQLAAKSIGTDPSNRWLITFAADGTNAKAVEPLGDNADKVTVSYSPDGSTIAFSDTADPVDGNVGDHDTLLIGQNGENFKSLRVDGFGFEPKWSPNGKQLLYSSAGQNDDYLPTLWFTDAKGNAIGDNRTDLGIHTWADMCTFASAQAVYCAVPDASQLPQGAGLQRDVADGVPDGIVKVDLVSGAVTSVGQPGQATAMKDLVVSADGSTLYYTDARSGSLSQMKLR